MREHWWVLAVVCGAGWVLFGFSAWIGRFPEMKKPLSRIRKEYLANMIAQKEKLEIEGIPAPLIYDAVALEDIFILPRFQPHRALVDQPLTDDISAHLGGFCITPRNGALKKESAPLSQLTAH